MPKAGFKSITVTENVYNRLFAVYEANQKELQTIGVNSFSGYVTHCLELQLKNQNIAIKYRPWLQKLTVNYDRVLLKDNIKNRVAEIIIKPKLKCMLCDSNSCMHIGFCYSIPEVYEIMGKNFG
ncbi:hypothetical protein LCGC14_0372900 [marine sediment metagenome]|uniref:Uncharacterized protein n=1 Tax=marine sediment metagenome TaxID=412755 RepID=A0A0F9TAS7_9ZZZZ